MLWQKIIFLITIVHPWQKMKFFDKNGASMRGKGTPGRHLLIRLICPPNRNLSILPKRFRQKCLSSSSPFQLATQNRPFEKICFFGK